jgi:plastocyanin
LKVWRRWQRGLVPAVFSSLSLLLVACGASDAISASNPTPTPDVEPNACSLLTNSQASTALEPVVPSSPAPAAAEVKSQYSVVTVSEGGTKQAGQCLWLHPSGSRLTALVIANTQLTQVADFTTNATQVGGAYIQEDQGRGFVSIQHGSSVIAITLVLNGDAAARTVRLANLIRSASGAPIPVVTAAPSAAPSASGTGGGSNAPGQVVTGQTAAKTVKETDGLKFNPTSVTAKAGDVIEWDNSGSVAHNVTFDAYSAITSDTMNGGDKFQLKFAKPGTYQYHCTFHPGMDGSLTVQ